MSLITKKGRAAAESAMSEGGNKAFESLVSFKSGTTYIVRVPSVNDFVEYFSHGVFNVFYSSTCTKTVGKEDLYCKAATLLYEDANKAKSGGDEELAKEIRQQAYQLKAKPRYLFGFFNVEDGEPILIDVSKKQAQALITAIDKYETRINSMPFEISKTGTGIGTTVSLFPMLESLRDKQQKNFDETIDRVFPEDLYSKVLYAKEESKQVEDLVAFGFDVNRLGIEIDDTDSVTPVDDPDFNDDDIPF